MHVLAGLLNVDEPEFVADLVKAGHTDFHRSLAAGDVDRARMLLRLFAALTAVNVVQPGSLLGALQSLASTALAAVETCGLKMECLTGPHLLVWHYMQLLLVPLGSRQCLLLASGCLLRADVCADVCVSARTGVCADVCTSLG